VEGEDGLDKAGDAGGAAPQLAQESLGLERGHGLLAQRPDSGMGAVDRLLTCGELLPATAVGHADGSAGSLVSLIGTVGWQLSVLAGAARDVWAVCSAWECFDKRDACTASADSSSVVIPCRGSSRSQGHLPISRSRGALHESEDPGRCWGHGRLMGWCARERFY